MPLYELTLVLRPMAKPEIVETLKRCANLIWKGNGVIKKIDFLGCKKLPYKIPSSTENEIYHEANYFTYHVSINSERMKEIRPEYKLDIDVIISKFNLAEESTIPENYECTLEEELKPPAYRESIKPLLESKNVRADVRR